MCLVVCVFRLSAQTEEDIERLNNEAFEAFDDFNYRRAIDLECTILKWLKKPHLKNDSNEFIVHLNLGGFYQSYQKYDSAQYYLEKCRELCIRNFGKQNDFFLHAALQLGGYYEAVEMLDEAEQVNNEAIEVIRRGQDEDWSLVSYILSNQAIVKKKKFKLKEALTLIEESEKITLREAGEESADYASALNTKAVILGELGEKKEQELLLDQAKKLCEKLGNKRSSTYGTILNNFGGLYSDKGEFHTAIQFYQSSYEVKASVYTEKSLECALVQANMGVVMGQAGKFSEGMREIEKSRDIVAELLGRVHPDWFGRSAMLGSLMEQAGMYKEADALYQELILGAQRSLGQKAPEYLDVLNNAALFYTNRGVYDKASHYYTEIWKNSEVLDEGSVCIIKGNYANFLHLTGRSGEAEKIYTENLLAIEQNSGKESFDYLQARHNRAVFFQDLGRLEEAKKEFEETGKTLRKLSGVKTPLYMGLQENLAGIYKDQEQYAEALRVYQELLGIRKENYGSETVDVADLYSKMAMCCNALDQPAQALEFMEKAYVLKVQVLGKDDPALSYETTLLATFYTYGGNYKKGVEYYAEAKRLITGQFHTFFRFMTGKEKLAFLTKTTGELKQLQAIAVENAPKYPAFTGLALDVELLMKGMVLESGNRIKQAVLKSGDPGLKSKYSEWQNLCSQLAVELSRPEQYRRSDWKDLIKKTEALEREIVTAVGAPGQETYSWQQVQKGLKKEEALVEFIRYKSFREEKETVAALVLKSGSAEPVLVYLYEEETFSRYLSSLKAGNDEGIVLALYGQQRGAGEIPNEPSQVQADSLYQYIWKPLSKELAGIKRLYYSPSGSVHKVSLAAIRNEEGRYLSESFELVTLSSGRMLTEKPEPFSFQSVLLMGGVQYDMKPEELSQKVNPGKREVGPAPAIRGGNGAKPWNYLDGTRTEVDGIAGLPGVKDKKLTVKTGQEAFEEQIKKDLKAGPDIVHLATHGYFFPEPSGSAPGTNVYQGSDNPLLRSGLILAGANNAWTGGEVPAGLEDGVLTAYEVSTMDLGETRLVVLSACETGLGDIMGSEGVFGLQRAFKQAGVEYVVMSLWQVPDKETVEFMELFYTNLGQGLEIEKAFNEARKVMREKYDPYYWAAFVLIR